MSRLENVLYALGTLDRLAAAHSVVHSLDPRAKILVTLACIVTAMSFGPHDLSGPLPLLLYPVCLAALGDIPAACVARRLLLASPFALCVGIFNPWLDTAPLLHVGPWAVSGGWMSFLSILLRFTITVSAAIVLIGVTGFVPLCAALPRMGVPRIFAAQLLFLYRYIHVLIREAARMERARDMRSFGHRGLGLKPFVRLLGQLLLRTLDRAHRIYQAMCCRGFDGELPHHGDLRYTGRDAAFMLGWLMFFALARGVNLPQLLGRAYLQLAGLFS